MNRFRLGVFALPIILLGACTSLSDQDRAALTSASQNAEQARAESARASEMARQAMEQSRTAQAQAQAANEKADRMFQRSLRK